jgi:hypothetical protein
MAFRFLQWLSAFFNGFLIFLNGFLIFLNGFPLSEKSKKIYLRRQVYERSPFKLRISCHSLPELCNHHLLPELCNRHSLLELRNCHLLPKLRNRYNACISPNTNQHDPPQRPFQDHEHKGQEFILEAEGMEKQQGSERGILQPHNLFLHGNHYQ